MSVTVKTSEYSEEHHSGADGFVVQDDGHLEVAAGLAVTAAYAKDCWESVQIVEDK